MNANKIVVALSVMAISFSVDAKNMWDDSKQTLAKPVDIVVYRNRSCNCCGKWISHLQKHNFKVKDIVHQNVDVIKKQLHIPASMASCHTAVVNGYWVEGHVPAGDIKTMLLTQPNIKGIAVPNMPVGTPGMEMSGRIDPFNVIALDKLGNKKLYKSYRQ